MRFLQYSRYVALIGVVFSLVAGTAAFLDGAVLTVRLCGQLLAHLGGTHHLSVQLVQLMDAFLLGSGLIIFGLGLHEMFIGELELPEALTVHTLSDLKGKLAIVIVLVMAVGFLEHFVEWQDGRETLLHGVAAALMSAALIALAMYGGHGGKPH